MTTFEPGRLYAAKVRGVETRVFRLAADRLLSWTTAESVEGRWQHDDDEVTGVRPLYVLDLKGWGGPERAVRLLRDDHWGPLADQIESQIPKPPKLPPIFEPNWGERVTASFPGETRLVWLRDADGPGPFRWVSQQMVRARWEDLIDPQPYTGEPS